MSATTSTSTNTSATSAATTAAPAARWAIDASHTSVTFAVRHMMISNVRGEFRSVSGEAVFDARKPEASRVSVTIDVGSISTRDDKRDEHLRSADFFDAATYPTIQFVSKEVRRRGEGLDVVGDLTIHGTTREVTLAVDEVTAERADPWGNHRFGATAHTKVKRSEFGLTWNAVLETGGVLVGDDIKISLDVEFIKQK
jgi:polyisoprenoid-binding protein YceI